MNMEIAGNTFEAMAKLELMKSLTNSMIEKAEAARENNFPLVAGQTEDLLHILLDGIFYALECLEAADAANNNRLQEQNAKTVKERIDAARSILESDDSHDMTASELQEIEGMSGGAFDMIGNGFLLGYYQGYHAAKNGGAI